jgi:hypothetical protein
VIISGHQWSLWSLGRLTVGMQFGGAHQWSSVVIRGH